MSEQHRQTLAPLPAIASRILIRGATVISMDGEVGNLPKGDILVENGTITAIGLNLEADGAEVIDAIRTPVVGRVDSFEH